MLVSLGLVLAPSKQQKKAVRAANQANKKASKDSREQELTSAEMLGTTTMSAMMLALFANRR